MNQTLFRGLTLACLTGMLPAIANAQICDSSGPINCTLTRPRPVVSTHLQARQVTTYCDVNETQMRSQQVVENVPVTTCKNVTVDEGGYQMVWVSKPVTKQVAQTVMQQRVKTVAVPVQVTRRVPQVSTQMFPVQTVQYVNETVPLQMTAMATGCSTCGGGFAAAPMFGSQISAAPIQYQPAPYMSAAIPTMPAITVPTYQTGLAPTPMQSTGAPTRSAEVYEETVPARNVPMPRDEAANAPKKTSMFRGVPSAASVWQTQVTR